MRERRAGPRALRFRRPIQVAAIVLALVMAVVAIVIFRQMRGTEVADGWERLFYDDFQTPAALGSFTAATPDDWLLSEGHPYADTLRSYPDGWGTTYDLGLYYPTRTLDVVENELGASGVLRVNAHSAVVDGRQQPLAAAIFPVIDPETDVRMDQTAQIYGRYTVRFRTVGGYRPDAAGSYPDSSAGISEQYGSAFLLWPSSNVWEEGEVDFPEVAWGGRISGYVHKIGEPAINTTEIRTEVNTSDDWVTATIEWYPDVLAFYLDGELVSRVSEDVPTTPFRWGIQSGPMANGVDPDATRPPGPDVTGALLIDWIEIQAYRGAIPPPPIG